MGSSEGHSCFAVVIEPPQTASEQPSLYLCYLFIGMILSVAISSVSDTRPCWCLKHHNIEALLVISLSRVPLWETCMVQSQSPRLVALWIVG